jgi:hypothetical protein
VGKGKETMNDNMCFTDLSEGAYKSEERKGMSSFGDFHRSQDRECRRSEEDTQTGAFDDLISDIEAFRRIHFEGAEEDHAGGAKNPGQIILRTVAIQKQDTDSVYHGKRSNCKCGPKYVNTGTNWGGILDGLVIDG